MFFNVDLKVKSTGFSLANSASVEQTIIRSSLLVLRVLLGAS
jgi:hypothetical protein